MKEATDARSVGFGGSRTVVDLGVQSKLQEQGKEWGYPAPGPMIDEMD